MIHKLAKISRYWRARLRPRSCRPLFWHVGVPNFGDDINAFLFEALCGVRVRFAADRSRPHFLGMGSILAKATQSSVVLGAGLLTPGPRPRPLGAVSVRGELSRRHLDLAGDIPLGDPMVLVNLLMRPDGGDDTGFVPHVSALPGLRGLVPANIRLIDVRRPPCEVVRQIGRCRLVFSQSLHGLIVADAFEIPNIWVAPNGHMVGGDFKFRDYFSTLDAPKQSHALSPDLFDDAARGAASVGRFTGSKPEYRAILRAALERGLPA